MSISMVGLDGQLLLARLGRFRRTKFMANLATRPRVLWRTRALGHNCRHPEAAKGKAFADTTALPHVSDVNVGLHRPHGTGYAGAVFFPSEDTFVNLGARSGLEDDPLQFLLLNPLHVEFALAAEMDPQKVDLDWADCDIAKLRFGAAMIVSLPRLDEVDCYAKSVVMAMWPNARTMRRWFYEEPASS
eukprot:Skav236659  [mRNA]  locus=scaffold3354:55101:61141:+ [translate_table: standard]